MGEWWCRSHQKSEHSTSSKNSSTTASDFFALSVILLLLLGLPTQCKSVMNCSLNSIQQLMGREIPDPGPCLNDRDGCLDVRLRSPHSQLSASVSRSLDPIREVFSHQLERALSSRESPSCFPTTSPEQMNYMSTGFISNESLSSASRMQFPSVPPSPSPPLCC